jgi:hypothetical protein
MNKLLLLTVLATLSLLVCLQAEAAVITFDDLGVPVGTYVWPMPSGYAGVTWDTSWAAVDEDYPTGGYSIPHSGRCMAVNYAAMDAQWFDFGVPVTFGGAWFARAPGSGLPTSSVMLSDNLGHATGWLTLTDAPQFLGPNWAGVTRITVNRDPYGWFTMDDVTYDAGGGPGNGTPELSTWVLLACSGLAGLVLRRRRKA